MYKVYGDYRSGNCYKIKLAMSLLGIDYQWIPVDILKGETQTPEFLAKNPNGKIPVLELEDGSFLWESNAILNFLADGSACCPANRACAPRCCNGNSSSNTAMSYVAVARFIKLYLGLPEARRAEFEEKKIGGYKALDVMEKQLSRTPFLVGEQFSIADITLYAYTHVAHEGGFDLTAYPAIRAWIKRVGEVPGYVGMLD